VLLVSQQNGTHFGKQTPLPQMWGKHTDRLHGKRGLGAEVPLRSYEVYHQGSRWGCTTEGGRPSQRNEDTREGVKTAQVLCCASGSLPKYAKHKSSVYQFRTNPEGDISVVSRVTIKGDSGASRREKGQGGRQHLEAIFHCAKNGKAINLGDISWR